MENYSTPDLSKAVTAPIDASTAKAIYHLAALRLVHDVSARGDVRPFVLPVSPVHEQAPMRYLEDRNKVLKRTLGDKGYQGDTLMTLIKLLAEGIAPDTRPILLKMHISWSQVLSASGHIESKTVRVKGKILVQRNLKVPVNPANNAYLGPQEKTGYSKLMKPYWSAIETIREKWSKLTSDAQHKEFDDYVKAIGLAYQDMNRFVTTIGRRLGHRKQVFDEVIKAREIKLPKTKTAVDKTLAVFQKVDDLRKMSAKDKYVFSPLYTCGHAHYIEDIWTKIKGKTLDEANTLLNALDTTKVPTAILFKFWINKFEPVLEDYGELTPANVDVDFTFNPFLPLEPKPGEGEDMNLG